MKYGALEFKVKYGSLSIAHQKNHIVRQYLFTNRSEIHDLGRPPSNINCVIYAETETEKDIIVGLLHTSSKRNLEVGDVYYKDVTPDTSAQFTPVAELSDGKWNITAKFIALDPIPYSVATDEPLY